MLDTGAQRELVSARLRRDADDYSIGAGARHVADTGLANGDTESEQAFVNGSLDLFKDLITLRASQDFALGGKNSSVDFGALGARRRLSLAAEHDVLRRMGARERRPVRRRYDAARCAYDAVGARAAADEHQPARDEFGPRLFANTGLTRAGS